MTIELSDKEFDTLLIMCGFAVGSAFSQHDKVLVNSFTRIVNAINRNNPNFKPYEVEDE